MKNLFKYVASHKLRVLIGAIGSLFILGLMFFRLGNLTPGMSYQELNTVNTPVGIRALLENSFYLPLEVVRSVVFWTVNDFGAVLGRAPNVLFGAFSVVCFAYIVRHWHGLRTALFASIMYACSAWVLHVSRIASFDVVYLCAIPILLASGILLEKHGEKYIIFLGVVTTWLIGLYIPGLVWLIALTVFWQRDILYDSWGQLKASWQKLLLVFAGIVTLPLLIVNLFRPSNFVLWLGAPDQLFAPLIIVKNLLAVGVHIVIRGPQYPEIWLDKLPILDIFTLSVVIAGVYFYLKHIKSFRSRMLFSYVVVAWLLIGAHGAVGLSLIVPLLYIFAAAGIAYLLREWLKMFPHNPLARSIGIGLICAVVALSCLYNIRSYFVAWPHSQVTKALFQHRR